jgi:superfamily II DNA/RNA helicase
MEQEILQRTLTNLKIESLKPMQEAFLKEFRENPNLLLLSPTGSGKTLAFLLPLFETLEPENKNVQAIILVPSRELALQITDVFKRMSTGFKVSCCYGGHDTKTEKNSLEQNPAVVIGTPGRLSFHVREQNFDVKLVHTLILDEFDKALEFGFEPDMKIVIHPLSGLKYKFLTSATKAIALPSFIQFKNHKELNYLPKQENVSKQLKLQKVVAQAKDKLDILFSLICKLEKEPMLVFCNHREAVDRISELLKRWGIVHEIFHGGMEQKDREKSLIKFRNGSNTRLITTDLASRGLDIPEIKHVIHYQLPPNEDAFIHRNGRTARMEATGSAYLILAEDEGLPSYIAKDLEKVEITGKNILPPISDWRTIYFGAGKKESVNKVDIVGFMLNKGALAKEELGRIEVLDHSSFAAVPTEKMKTILSLVKDEKIKGKKIKIEEAF